MTKTCVGLAHKILMKHVAERKVSISPKIQVSRLSNNFIRHERTRFFMKMITTIGRKMQKMCTLPKVHTDM